MKLLTVIGVICFGLCCWIGLFWLIARIWRVL